jgi:hypothetical protein
MVSPSARIAQHKDSPPDRTDRRSQQGGDEKSGLGACLASQTAIGDGLGELRGLDDLEAGQIGDGAGHPEDAVYRAWRQAQALDGAAEESPIARPQAAIALDLGQAQAAAGLARATAQTFKADAPFRS